MRTGEVDPRDDAAFGAWFGVLAASLEDERPGEPTWTAVEQRGVALRLLEPAGERTGVLLAAYDDDGTAVGAARLALPQRDNPRLGQVLLHVLPAARRRGVGRALLSELADRAAAAGRSVLVSEVDEPVRGCAPGRAFAERLGATCALLDVRRDLLLPVPEAHLDALAAACRPYAAGYEVVTWRDRTPAPWEAERADLARRMSTEAPVGDLPSEEEAWDVARLRAHESGILAQDRTWFTAVAVHAGRLVGVTDLGVPLALPERAYQWTTLVLPEHRGHRLGTLLKVATLRALQDARLGTRLVSTWNAEVNAPMIAVNEALGARVAGAMSEWVLALPLGARG